MAILKPDKGNGVVLLSIKDYYTTMKNLFSDHSKFRQIYKDPMPKRFTPLLSYLKQLDKKDKLPDAIYNNISPKHA